MSPANGGGGKSLLGGELAMQPPRRLSCPPQLTHSWPGLGLQGICWQGCRRASAPVPEQAPRCRHARCK